MLILKAATYIVKTTHQAEWQVIEMPNTQKYVYKYYRLQTSHACT